MVPVVRIVETVLVVDDHRMVATARVGEALWCVGEGWQLERRARNAEQTRRPYRAGAAVQRARPAAAAPLAFALHLVRAALRSALHAQDADPVHCENVFSVGNWCEKL